MKVFATITEKDGGVKLYIGGVDFDPKTGRAIIDGVSWGPSYDFTDQQDVAPFIAKFEKINQVKVEVRKVRKL